MMLFAVSEPVLLFGLCPLNLTTHAHNAGCWLAPGSSFVWVHALGLLRGMGWGDGIALAGEAGYQERHFGLSQRRLAGDHEPRP